MAARDPRLGVAVAVGVLPAAIVGLPPRRRGRLALILLGALTGLPMVVGGVLASVPVLAVAAIGGLRSGRRRSPPAPSPDRSRWSSRCR